MHNLDEPVVVVYLSWGTKDNKDDPTKGADFFKVRFFFWQVPKRMGTVIAYVPVWIYTNL